MKVNCISYANLLSALKSMKVIVFFDGEEMSRWFWYENIAWERLLTLVQYVVFHRLFCIRFEYSVHKCKSR
ncbi:hypothetical protein GCM10007877_07780 [Marinibactrum halimedae]|uniref:Uncharacterized protein n=1 Tax=Marinibactrum halimedae TaxID=1444977 RepID=A0AA37T1A1_9GAMM|nr:hypothetical protein GCM10007877_07780 [Marinibactrum halimedae]